MDLKEVEFYWSIFWMFQQPCRFHHIMHILLILFNGQKWNKDSSQSPLHPFWNGLYGNNIQEQGKKGQHTPKVHEKSNSHLSPYSGHTDWILTLMTFKLFFYIVWDREYKLYIMLGYKRKLCLWTFLLSILLYYGGITSGSNWNHHSSDFTVTQNSIQKRTLLFPIFIYLFILTFILHSNHTSWCSGRELWRRKSMCTECLVCGTWVFFNSWMLWFHLQMRKSNRVLIVI